MTFQVWGWSGTCGKLVEGVGRKATVECGPWLRLSQVSCTAAGLHADLLLDAACVVTAVLLVCQEAIGRQRALQG